MSEPLRRSVKRRLHPIKSAYYGVASRGGRRERKFRSIFTTNAWGDADSVSGVGSNLDQTATIRRELPGLFERHGITRLVDAPCGDLHWFRRVPHELEEYIGCDIVPELVADLAAEPPVRNGRFQLVDIVTNPVPAADAILCRDCLVHLSYHQINSAVANFKRSGSRLLITTTFTDALNHDVATGGWRALNLQADPFNWPKPLELLVENCSEGGGAFADKSLGVWQLEDLPSPSRRFGPACP